MKKVSSGFIALLFILVSASNIVEAASPLSQIMALKDQKVTHIGLPALDLAKLRSKAFDSSPEKTLKFAQVNEYSIDAITSEGWTNVVHEQRAMSIWRLVIESPNAYSINLGFTQYQMPIGASLFVYADGYEHMVRPFTDADNEQHGQLWTPIVPARKIVVEVNVPTNLKQDLRLELSKVNQAYLDVTRLHAEFKALKSGSCNFDVVCPQGNGWRDQIQSVAALSINGFFFCTGAAINNTANDKRPFFLTANHCGVGSGNAPSLVAYWNYQNSTCRTPGSAASGGSGDGPLSQFNTGAIFRASYSPSDMTLVEFDDPVLSSANVFFSGWNRANSAFSSSVTIHHPNVEEKRISFENNPVTISGYLNPTGVGNTHIRVEDWDLGTTEPGSSGSPLFDPNKRIIGQLHGGFAACGNDDADWYGRINQSWTGGGTNSSRLRNWLDPLNTGASAINGIFASSPVIPSEPNEDTISLQSIYLLLDED